MRRVRTYTISFEHLLGVSVVGRDQCHASVSADRLDDLAQAFVGCLDGFHRGGDGSCVADHVRVGQVQDREAIAVAIEPLERIEDGQWRWTLSPKTFASFKAGTCP